MSLKALPAAVVGNCASGMGEIGLSSLELGDDGEALSESVQTKLAALVVSGPADELTELTLRTVASVVSGRLSVTGAVKAWQDARVGEFQNASNTLADALWFSGTQVRPPADLCCGVSKL